MKTPLMLKQELQKKGNIITQQHDKKRTSGRPFYAYMEDEIK